MVEEAPQRIIETNVRFGWGLASEQDAPVVQMYTEDPMDTFPIKLQKII